MTAVGWMIDTSNDMQEEVFALQEKSLHENTDTHTSDTQTLIHIPLDKRTDQKKTATHGSVHGIL